VRTGFSSGQKPESRLTLEILLTASQEGHLSEGRIIAPSWMMAFCEAMKYEGGYN